MLFPLLFLGVSDLDPGRIERRFPARPESARAARNFVLSTVMTGEEEAEMRLSTLVSELATNAILHARTPFKVRVEHDGSTIRVAVSDESPEAPAKRSYGPEHPTGRGLLIVESFADRWGVVSEGEGKTVWFELDPVGV
jgi:anti-sigma regulatory factor (Ser/Thr protein kinase)